MSSRLFAFAFFAAALTAPGAARASDPTPPPNYGAPPRAWPGAQPGYPPPGAGPYGHYGQPGYPPPGYYPPYAYPPPGYGYYGYGQPYTPVPKERRSLTAMVTGIVLTSVGGVFGVTGVAVASTDHVVCGGNADVYDCSNETPVGGIIMAVAGFIGVAVGIPLIVYGAKEVPVVQTTPMAQRWLGEPAKNGWQWRF